MEVIDPSLVEVILSCKEQLHRRRRDRRDPHHPRRQPRRQQPHPLPPPRPPGLGRHRASRRAYAPGETVAVIERLSYDPHGKRRLANWTAGDPVSPNAETPRGFTGHEHLDSVGLIHMNGRVYDPVLGRFLSADPVIPDPTALQTFNRYSYVYNNPLSYTDPSGFIPDDGNRAGPSLGDRIGDAVRDFFGGIFGAAADFANATGITDLIGVVASALTFGSPVLGGVAGHVAGGVTAGLKSKDFGEFARSLTLAGLFDGLQSAAVAAGLGTSYDPNNEEGHHREGRDRADGIQLASADVVRDFPYDGPGVGGQPWNSPNSVSVWDYASVGGLAVATVLLAVSPFEGPAGEIAAGLALAVKVDRIRRALQIAVPIAGASTVSRSSPQILYHYTTEEGMMGIVGSGMIMPSTLAKNPNDARYGTGQYLTDISPGTMTSAQLSRSFLGVPWQGKRFTHYVGIDVNGLNVHLGREHVYVVPNEVPLPIRDRIVTFGAN